MKKQWQILKPDIPSVKKIYNTIKCNPVIAAILVNRKISPENVDFFLNPSINNIRSPFSIKDMDAAVDRIYSSIIQNEKILIFGDYDADGITSTTILFEFLRYSGADVGFYIPQRMEEGYGLQTSHIINFALPDKINLIITVDCGSGSHAAVEAAQNAGIDVIITDHHKISENLPPAVAVVNPKRHDCTSGFDNLAGVGVVFYLLICLRKQMRDKHFWQKRTEPNLKNVCDLVAIGTVADIVPLVDENRIITKTGLDIINSSDRTGINALMDVSKIKKHSVDTTDIAFRLAPRLNAPGRLGHAKSAVELLTATDFDAAMQTAGLLDRMNTQRQDMEKKLFDQIAKYLSDNPLLLKQRAILLSHNTWHEGILGIVASRLVKIYFRPVVLISTNSGIGKGSARSIPAFDLYDGLSACSNDLESFGGHAMAAGLKIKVEKIGIFHRNFENIVKKTTAPDDFEPVIYIDCELNFDDISDKLINEIELLKPFGAGNREPVFIARNIKVSFPKIVGGNHRRMLLSQPSGKTDKTINAIHFNIDPALPIAQRIDKIAFRLRWNHWEGKKTAQIVIEDI